MAKATKSTGEIKTAHVEDPAGENISSAAPATTATKSSPNTAEAKSRFNAALEEAKAGATALGAEVRERAAAYTGEAKTKGESYKGDAKAKAGELAVEGKAKASSALSGLSKLVDENAATIDDRLGVKYGDYARSASKSIQGAADKLEAKSVDELTDDAREAIRKSPAAAVGLAALAGFMLARIFRK